MSAPARLGLVYASLGELGNKGGTAGSRLVQLMNKRPVPIEGRAFFILFNPLNPRKIERQEI